MVAMLQKLTVIQCSEEFHEEVRLLREPHNIGTTLFFNTVVLLIECYVVIHIIPFSWLLQLSWISLGSHGSRRRGRSTGPAGWSSGWLPLGLCLLLHKKDGTYLMVPWGGGPQDGTYPMVPWGGPQDGTYPMVPWGAHKMEPIPWYPGET